MLEAVVSSCVVFGAPIAFYVLMRGMWGPDRHHEHREIAVGKHKGFCACGLPMLRNRPNL